MTHRGIVAAIYGHAVHAVAAWGVRDQAVAIAWARCSTHAVMLAIAQGAWGEA